MKKKTTVEIGFKEESLSGQFTSVQDQIKEIQTWLDDTSTSEYISTLLERINREINATGGYTYLVEGLGLVTYDKPVTDPSIGAEADEAVEIRGGSIRIANTKDAQGNWQWKTVFTAGHIAGDLVTAAAITTGYIGSAGSTFIDLDNNIIQLGGGESYITLDDEKLGFVQNGEVVAYMQDNMLSVENGEFLTKLRIGNFEFRPRSTGNLSFVYIGDENV